MKQFRHITAQRSVTLQEVAKAAGVSASAASAVLNGAKSGTRVSAATQRTLIEAAKRLNYRPHGVAQSLATGRSGRLGIYSGQTRLDIRNSFFAEVLTGVFESAEQFRLDTVVHTSGNDEARLVDLVRGHSLDGLIVHPAPDDPILSLLCDLQVPAVLIADARDDFPSITVDDHTGGTLLAEHLISKGHKHVMVKQSCPARRSATDRIAAFTETCHLRGVRVTESIEGSGGETGLDASDIDVLTRSRDRATAVMGWSDFVAETICRDLEAAGVSIPGDVAVVGFDGFEHRFTPKFNVTTIVAPWVAVGLAAVQQLHALILAEAVPIMTTLPVSIRVGNTT